MALYIAIHDLYINKKREILKDEIWEAIKVIQETNQVTISKFDKVLTISTKQFGQTFKEF